MVVGPEEDPRLPDGLEALLLVREEAAAGIGELLLKLVSAVGLRAQIGTGTGGADDREVEARLPEFLPQDLVLDLPKRRRWAIEIKRSSAPTVSRGFHIGAGDLKATARFVVHAGQESFPLAQGVQATTLANLQRALVDLGSSR